MSAGNRRKKTKNVGKPKKGSITNEERKESLPLDTILRGVKHEFILYPLGEPAVVKETRTLQNNMKKYPYSHWKVKFNSSMDAPRAISNVKVSIRGEEDTELKDFQYEYSKRLPENVSNERRKEIKLCATDGCNSEVLDPAANCMVCNGDEFHIKHEVSFKIPINIDGGQTKTFQSEYRSNFFQRALEGKPDFIALNIRRVIDNMVIVVRLCDGIRDKCRLVYPKDKGGRIMDIEIVDDNGNPMRLAEEKYREEGIMPVVSKENNEIRWEIKLPIIGYQYKLFFTTRPRKKK